MSPNPSPPWCRLGLGMKGLWMAVTVTFPRDKVPRIPVGEQVWPVRDRLSDAQKAIWSKDWHLVTYVSGFPELGDLKAKDLFIIAVPFQKKFKAENGSLWGLGAAWRSFCRTNSRSSEAEWHSQAGLKTKFTECHPQWSVAKWNGWRWRGQRWRAGLGSGC